MTPMTQLDPSLADLAHRFGVATHYHDWSGRHVAVEETTLVAVLAALGVDAGTEHLRAAALSDSDRRYWSRSCPIIPKWLARAKC